MQALTRRLPLLNWIALISVAATMGMIFFYAPTESTMGNVQRIFYFHVGTAWVAVVTYGVALVGGIMYLRSADKRWDTISTASVEVGLVFLTITIAAGSIWGRPAWNTYWVWSPRLILVTVMWLVYAAYFILRGAVDDEQKRYRFASVYVIAAFVTVIMTYGSIRVLRDIHPVMFGGAAEGVQVQAEGLQQFQGGLEEMAMGITLTVSCVAFTLLYLAWLANRYRLQTLRDEADQLKARVIARLQQ